jgi:type II secretory pathway component GspD/PulD (secretin)
VAQPITLDVRDATLADVIALLSAESGVNVVADDTVENRRVTLHLRGVSFEGALAVLLQAHGLQVRREGSTLIVGAADAMNRRYDDGSSAFGARTAVLTLRYADPDDVTKELVAALPASTVIVADKRTRSIVVSADDGTIARTRQLVAALDAPESGTGGSGAHVYLLKYGKASSLAKLLKDEGVEGTIVADDDRNAVIATGDDREQREIAGLVSAADVASPQVLFEVRVADVQPINETSDVGLEFGGTDLQGQPLSGAATYAFSSGTVQINARLNAMITEGRAQVLATPKLLTLNNREANLLIGETYPIVYQTSAFGGQQVQFVDIGVKLRLTPTIGQDGSVTAELHPEYSEVEGFAANGLPIIANRKIDSTLRVNDGQTIVLGGLLREVTSETVTRIPGLSSIPILGAFFTDKQRTHQRSEIVFLITPHVIYPGDVPPAK